MRFMQQSMPDGACLNFSDENLIKGLNLARALLGRMQ